MSSAIEYFKELKTNDEVTDYDMEYIREAIVALEQKEKLKEWCVEKISLCKKTNKYYDLNKADYYSARIKTLKEVLELMK